jgi:hypothetical protein
LAPYIKILERDVNAIDYDTKRKNITRRLGGEFDYEKFV